MLGLSEDQAQQRLLKDIVARESAALVEQLVQRSPQEQSERLEIEVVGAPASAFRSS
jgi:hypothetical protein